MGVERVLPTGSSSTAADVARHAPSPAPDRTADCASFREMLSRHRPLQGAEARHAPHAHPLDGSESANALHAATTHSWLDGNIDVHGDAGRHSRRTSKEDGVERGHRERGRVEEGGAQSTQQGADLSTQPAILSAPSSPPPGDVSEAGRRLTLEAMLPQLVTSIAYAKESARKGSIRMDFGAGTLKGGSMFVETDDRGRVAVKLTVPRGENADEWRTRIQEALTRRGVKDADVHVA